MTLKKVVLLFRQGPLAGRRMELELGQTLLGRDPGPHGVTLPGDATVSRQHGELVEEQGRVVFRNLSPNGTLVDRRIVQGAEELEPGAQIHFGDEHVIEVQFLPAPKPEPEADTGAGLGALLRSGPLARPLVRLLLGVYLAGLIALGIFFALQGKETLQDRFEPVREQYEARYRPAGVEPSALKLRLKRAEQLVREIQALERSENWQTAREGYRELMALDGDPSSPVYRFAARQLGSIVRGR